MLHPPPHLAQGCTVKEHGPLGGGGDGEGLGVVAGGGGGGVPAGGGGGGGDEEGGGPPGPAPQMARSPWLRK